MIKTRVTWFERLIAPAPITTICFLGFIVYVVEFAFGGDPIFLTSVSLAITVMAVLLMSRPYIRQKRTSRAKFKKYTSAIMDTPDEVIERQQKRIDKDATYFGSIIFILSAMYMMFAEISRTI